MSVGEWSFPPSWNCIIISILSVVMESNMPCNAYQFYLFLEVKLINFSPAFHKRASLVISFNFDPSEVWRRQRTRLLYLCCMLTCLPKVHPEFIWIWSLQEVIILLVWSPSMHLIYLQKFYVHEYFASMYVHIPCTCWVPTGARWRY